MSVSLFDANFYRVTNPDLATAGLTTDAQLLSHFQTYGLDEGRRFSPLVDLNFYRASNSDLAGLSNRQAFDHLQNYGVAEGRRFSPSVDLNFYRASNGDLAGFNNEQLFDHLRNYGVNEGRLGSYINTTEPDAVGAINSDRYLLTGTAEGDALAQLHQADVLLSTSRGKVGSFDPLTGIFTPIITGRAFTDIALSSKGELFGITVSQLYEIDLNSRSASLIGNLGSGDFNALEFAANDVLYSSSRSRFYSVDTQTGAATLIADLRNSGFNSSGDLAFDPVSNLFYVTSSGATDDLYTLTLDGIATKVGNVGFKGVFGLSLSADGNLFGYTQAGQQIIIDKQTGNGTLQRNISFPPSEAGQISGATEGNLSPSEDSTVTETINVPFTGGPSAVTTRNTYSGSIEVAISGIGQAAETSYSDAFYRFTDERGSNISPVPANEFGLYIDGKPAQDIFSLGQTVPAYNPQHSYSFRIDAPSGPLTFGVGDLYTVDNTGSYSITVTDVI